MALDDREKSAVEIMRSAGLGYKAIAQRLGLNRDQVRSYASHIEATENPANMEADRFCRWCGQLLPARSDARRQDFCSEKHRRSWWHTHPQFALRKAIYHYTCLGCGIAFKAYGNSQRKYCSHSCYVNTRFHHQSETP